MDGTHSTGEKRAKRMPDPTMETTILMHKKVFLIMRNYA